MQNSIRVIITFCAYIIFITCSAQTLHSKLQNSVWACKIVPGCINKYYFDHNSSYKFYSCEIQDTMYGSYRIEKDTIILYENGSIGDPEVNKAMFKIIIQDDQMYHVYRYEWINNDYQKSNFVFDKKYTYQQIEH